MDEAGSRARISSMTRPPDIKDIDKEIEAIKAQKEAAIKAQDFEKAAALRDTEKQAKERKDAVLEQWRANTTEARPKRKSSVTDEDIMRVVVSEVDRHSAPAHGAGRGREVAQDGRASCKGNASSARTEAVIAISQSTASQSR